MKINDAEKAQPRILLIHPQSDTASTLFRRLSSLDIKPEVFWAKTLKEALKCVSESLFNLIVVHYQTSNRPINQMIDELMGQAPGIPLVLSCDKSFEENAKELLSRGLMDYLVLPRDGNKATLGRVLRFAINQQLNEEEITKLTQYDLLTGVANRYLFRDRLSQAVIRSQRSGKTLAVLIIDVDQFHAFNEQQGYQLGDSLLKEVSRRIVKSVRRQDTVARLGGDEFSVVLEALNEPQDAGIIAKEMLDQFNTLIEINGQSHQITLSMGIAVSSEHVLDPDTLTKQADIARYRAKENGGNSFEFFSMEDNEEYQDRHLAAEELNQTLNRIFNED